MNDLKTYIESLPEPRTLREKLLVLWSNLLDWFATRRKRNDTR